MSQRRLLAGRSLPPTALALSLVGEQLLSRHLGQSLALLGAQSAVRQAVARLGMTVLRAGVPGNCFFTVGWLFGLGRRAGLGLGSCVGS